MRPIENSNSDKKYLIRGLIGFAIYLFLSPALLFFSAGTVKWPLAWAYSITTVTITALSRLLLIIKSPDLALERASHRQVEGVKAWDRILSAIVGLFGNLAILLVAGLDQRFGWSPLVELKFSVGALVLGLSAGFLLGSWAMLENRYFSAVVRVQSDRGHTVCSTGPYRFVRHPGYAGALLFYLLIPIMLGTLWALLPAALTAIALVIRTALEDKTLQDELEGYLDYTKDTRYRLLPGIW